MDADAATKTDRPAPRQDRSKRTRLSRDERRALLLEAAQAEFAKYGYGGATTRGIANRAGVTEAVMYRHFPSKEVLFEEAVAAPLERAISKVASLSADAAAEGDIDELLALTDSFFRELLTATSEIAPLLAGLLTGDPERGAAFYREHLAPVMSASTEVAAANLTRLGRGAESTELIVRIVYGFCWYNAIDEHFNGVRRFDPATLAAELTKFVSRAIEFPIARET